MDFRDTIVDLRDTIVDFRDTIVDFRDTTAYFPRTTAHLGVPGGPGELTCCPGALGPPGSHRALWGSWEAQWAPVCMGTPWSPMGLVYPLSPPGTHEALPGARPDRKSKARLEK